MKTTEIFVEQVLIGFIVLLIGALPFLDSILQMLDSTEKLVGSAVVVTGVAYLLGIPFDEVVQTALSPVAYTVGTDFKPARGRELEGVLHVDGW